MKLSIVIPLYNKEFSIARAIHSVLAQTHKEFELIVVNDGSTDNSLEEARKINDHRIKIVNQKNKGVSAARNRGVEKATSDFVCLLDADDEWKPGFLKAMASLISNEPEASMYTCRFLTVCEQGSAFLGRTIFDKNFSGEIENFFYAYTKSRSLINSSSVCLNKKYLKQMGGFPETVNVGEDIFVWLQMASLAPVMHTSEVLSIIHRDSENRTVSRVSPSIPYHINYFFNIDGRGDSELVLKYPDLRKFILHNALFHAVGILMQGDRSLVRTISREVWRYSFFYSIAIFFTSFAPLGFIKKLRAVRNRPVKTLKVV